MCWFLTIAVTNSIRFSRVLCSSVYIQNTTTCTYKINFWPLLCISIFSETFLPFTFHMFLENFNIYDETKDLSKVTFVGSGSSPHVHCMCESWSDLSEDFFISSESLLGELASWTLQEKSHTLCDLTELIFMCIVIFTMLHFTVNTYYRIKIFVLL